MPYGGESWKYGNGLAVGISNKKSCLNRSPLTGAKPRLKPRLLASPPRSQSQSRLQAKILAWLGLIKPGLWLLGFWLEAKPRASLGMMRVTT